jgi:hypothetical protein
MNIMETEEVIYIEDKEAYQNGLNILFECYDECMEYEQFGGKDSKDEVKKSSSVLSKLFSPKVKAGFTRTVRGFLRTGTGLAADVATVGAGGDVVVNSLFAVESSVKFLNYTKILFSSLGELKLLFDKLLIFDFKKVIPVRSKLNLDGGYQMFEYNFELILATHVKENGTKLLDKIHETIIKIIDKITTTVSDWIACLFPDTAGLAGEIAKTVLDSISKNGFTYIYNLTSVIPDRFQKMITNIYALRDLVRKALLFLRNLLANLNNQQIAAVIQSLGVKTSNLTNSNNAKSAVSLGSKAVTLYTKAISYTPAFLILNQAKKIIIYAIDKYAIPNVNTGINLFNQLYPMFLMFTLYIEKYPLIIKGQITITPPNPIVPPKEEDKNKEEYKKSNRKVIKAATGLFNTVVGINNKPNKNKINKKFVLY